ncbi:TauD/TfdA family dioxygenase [Litchfieldella xinjiangensis]|uniref:TauD/TfdA family dioxygenase n=1 Tax=Litchfieldella xinjiangensis TaxID=1166948 RepID=UPI0005BD62F1|nr:TauD/TfdA family dioxygenase [Halomonas xinjiangensis]
MPLDTPTTSSSLPPTPDYDAWPVEVQASHVHFDQRQVELHWRDGVVSRFHSVWLRENAADDSTINPATRERILDLSTLEAWPTIDEAYLDAQGALCVRFAPEDKLLRFHPGWLRANDYSNTESPDAPLVPVTLWTGDTLAEPKSLDASGWLDNDEASPEVESLLGEALSHVMSHGLVRLQYLPTEPGTLEAIAQRIGPLRSTNFGTLFNVKAKPDPDSNAYTSIALPPHVDLPTREYQPGLQLLHCLENSVEGGQAVMMDGFAIAEALREQYPTDFETLTRVKWCYANTARVTDYVWFDPMIKLDDQGRLLEVRIADFLRGPLMAPFDDVEPAYAALVQLQRLLKEPRFAMRFTYRPGDLVIFDNRRLLHARDAFEGSSGHRWLQGCYLERDEVRSRLRMLRRAERLRQVEGQAG